MRIYGLGIEACIYLVPDARTVICRIFVVPAEAGIERLKSLDHGLKHAGMTTKLDGSGFDPFNLFSFRVGRKHVIKRIGMFKILVRPAFCYDT